MKIIITFIRSLFLFVFLFLSLYANQKNTTRFIKNNSKEINRLIEEELGKSRERVNSSVDDFVFVKRAYLNIIGRIPTVKETQLFVRSSYADKKALLIRKLLYSDGYNIHTYNYWADILRVRFNRNNQRLDAVYINWIQNSIRNNMPYDEMVRSLLSKKGAYAKEGNEAMGYYFRDRGMPLENMATTVRTFLGTRLECAQCHDHPFDKWSQLDFYQTAAFVNGMGSYNLNSKENREKNKIIKQMEAQALKNKNRKGRSFLRSIKFIIGSGFQNGGLGAIQLPETYAYDDAKPGQIVPARTPFGEEIKIRIDPNKMNQFHKALNNNKNQKNKNIQKKRSMFLQLRLLEDLDSKKTYANWITSSDNPRFTKVIVNRLWKKVMGIGLIEPVDDIKDNTIASNPKLLEYFVATNDISSL